MLQDTQQYPGVGTELQVLPDACTVDLPGQVDTLKIVPCPICRATYLPSDAQIARSSTVLLETAFLGICRFCFRCQRPACPQCWNPVHHTCASCSEEARLPFRAPVPSLKGLVFLPSTAAHARSENMISFTCQRNGRFYAPEPAPALPDLREFVIQPVPTTSKPVASDALPTVQANHAVPAQEPREIDHYPLWLQEVLGQKVDEPSTLSTSRGEQVENSTTSYAQTEPTGDLMYTPNWQQMVPMVQQQMVPSELSSPSAPTGQLLPPALLAPAGKRQSEPLCEEDADDDSSLFERIENVLIVITSILLLAVVLMIVLSILSVQVNTFFLHLLHIDIRTEIAYLLQLR